MQSFEHVRVKFVVAMSCRNPLIIFRTCLSSRNPCRIITLRSTMRSASFSHLRTGDSVLALRAYPSACSLSIHQSSPTPSSLSLSSVALFKSRSGHVLWCLSSATSSTWHGSETKMGRAKTRPCPRLFPKLTLRAGRKVARKLRGLVLFLAGPHPRDELTVHVMSVMRLSQ